MGGRGRGRGQTPFNQMQLEQMGFGRGGEAVPVAQTQPPPLFPPLENRPLPLLKDVQFEYILVTQKDLTTRMMKSPFFLKSSRDKNSSQSYSDPGASCMPDQELPILWNRMPFELRKKTARKRAAVVKRNPKVKQKRLLDDPSSILAKLEERESEMKDDDAEEDKKESEDEENKDSDVEKVDLDEEGAEDIDEEMDEGTDYAKDFFDNGEAYGDEDDAGPDDEPYF